MTGDISALIVDDDAVTRRNLADLLSADPDVRVAGEAASAAEAVERIRSLEPDIVLLDVDLGDSDGFSVLGEVEEDRWPVVVFVTAHDRHAVRAFEVHAVDFLLKPFGEERFSRALERAKVRVRDSGGERFRERIEAVLGEVADARSGGVERIAVRSSSRVRFVEVAELDWVEAAGDYVRLHAGGRSLLHRETMAEMEKILPAGEFVRIHRSTIVRLDRIASIQFEDGGHPYVVLGDGTRRSLSRNGRSRLEEALGESL